MEGSILPQVFLPIATGLFTSGYGAYVETRYVSLRSIAVTVGNVLITLLFTTTNSIGFYTWLAFSTIGIIIITRDAKNRSKNPYVAFFLGSKTIGSITIFLGLTTNDLVMPIFQPIFMIFADSLGLESLTGLDLQITIHVLGVLIVLSIVHVIGRIIGTLHKHHKFLF